MAAKIDYQFARYTWVHCVALCQALVEMIKPIVRDIVSCLYASILCKAGRLVAVCRPIIVFVYHAPASDAHERARLGIQRARIVVSAQDALFVVDTNKVHQCHYIRHPR